MGPGLKQNKKQTKDLQRYQIVKGGLFVFWGGGASGK